MRWDSLGEFLAIAVSIEELAEKTENATARLIGDALNDANSRYLASNKGPSRKVGELDNRGSHYYLAMYWAQSVAENVDDPKLAERFAAVGQALAENEARIISELEAAQGEPVDIGGYFHPNDELAANAMRPSATLNAIIDAI